MGLLKGKQGKLFSEKVLESPEQVVVGLDTCSQNSTMLWIQKLLLEGVSNPFSAANAFGCRCFQ